MDTFEKLSTTIDIDGLYDIVELKEVHASWMGAAQRNAEQRGAEQRRLEQLRRGGV